MRYAETYFLLSALSYPFICLYNAGAALFLAQGNSKISMMSSLVTVSYTHLNARRVRFTHKQRKNYFKFAMLETLRIFQHCLFTGKGRSRKRHLCQKAQKNPGVDTSEPEASRMTS